MHLDLQQPRDFFELLPGQRGLALGLCDVLRVVASLPPGLFSQRFYALDIVFGALPLAVAFDA